MGLLALATTVNAAAEYVDLAAYNTAMDALVDTARTCDTSEMTNWDAFKATNADAAITGANKQTDGSNDDADIKKFVVKIPTSGWALKRFSGVKGWVNNQSNDEAKVDKVFVTVEKGTPTPVAV